MTARIPRIVWRVFFGTHVQLALRLVFIIGASAYGWLHWAVACLLVGLAFDIAPQVRCALLAARLDLSATRGEIATERANIAARRIDMVNRRIDTQVGPFEGFADTSDPNRMVS